MIHCDEAIMVYFERFPEINIMWLCADFRIAMQNLFSIGERLKQRSTRPAINFICEIQTQQRYASVNDDRAHIYKIVILFKEHTKETKPQRMRLLVWDNRNEAKP